MKFPVKLTALFSGIFLVIGSITSYLVYTSNLKILESQIKDELEVQAFHTIDKIDRMLFERFTDIKVIATDPVISSRNSTPKQIRERLIAYRNNFRSYVSLSFFDLNRVMITDTIGIDIGKQHPRITYWLDIAGGKEFVFDVSKSIPLGFSIFHFAMVVKDKNGFPFGVVVIRMPVEKLYDITKRTFGMDQAVEQDFKIDLVNKEGLLIYSNYNRKGILNEIMPDWENLKRFLKTGKKIGSFREHYQGEDVIHVFALEQGYLDFKGGDWTLIIHAPTKVIFAPAMELRNRLIIVLLVVGFLALFIIFLFSYTITKPLARLNNASIEIGKGNFDAKVEISSKDEIGQLSVSFNKMVEDIKEYRDKLLAYSSELETKVAERTIELKNANERLQLELIERKRTEEELYKSEERYNLAVQATNDGIWDWNIETNHEYFSSRWCEILGYSDDDPKLLHTYESWASRIHPDDYERVMDALKTHLEKGKVYDVDYRHRHKSGEYRWQNSKGQAIFDKNGKPIRMVGSIRDITDHKRVEEEREKLIHELQDALGKIKTLSGLLPICASCKKIRDDKGYWNQIEAYIGDHSEAEFTHSICPECMKKLYPDF
jgi:PAS domain S-box-containing protein